MKEGLKEMWSKKRDSTQISTQSCEHRNISEDSKVFSVELNVLCINNYVLQYFPYV